MNAFDQFSRGNSWRYVRLPIQHTSRHAHRRENVSAGSRNKNSKGEILKECQTCEAFSREESNDSLNVPYSLHEDHGSEPCGMIEKKARVSTRERQDSIARATMEYIHT